MNIYITAEQEMKNVFQNAPCSLNYSVIPLSLAKLLASNMFSDRVSRLSNSICFSQQNELAVATVKN